MKLIDNFVNGFSKITLGVVFMLFGVGGMVAVLTITESSIIKLIGFGFFFLLILFAIFLESPIYKKMKAPEEGVTTEFVDYQ